MVLPIIKPMLASLGDAPFDSPEFIYELKWDGYRCVAYCDDKGIRLVSRTSKSLTERFNIVARDLSELADSCILDGEIVVLNPLGKPDFSALQSKTASSIATYIVFDLLYWRGRTLINLPLIQRREQLVSLLGNKRVGHLRVSGAIFDQGKQFFELAAKEGLEGIVAKDKQSLYYPGQRSKAWIKLKNRRRLYAVIAGYLPSKEGFASLCLAQFKEEFLFYIGNVGTGFSQKDMDILVGGFQRILRSTCPFMHDPNKSSFKKSIWLEPILVAKIEYLEFTKEKRLRQPSFLGLASEIQANECQLASDECKGVDSE